MYEARTPETLRLLLVEDDQQTSDGIRQTLEDHFGRGCIRCVTTIDEAMKTNIGRLDLVISDMYLPDGTGLTLLSEMLLLRPDLPFVLVTGDGNVELAMMAIRAGAYDYIIKAGDYLFTISMIVEKSLAIWKTKQDYLRLQQKLTETLEEVSVKNRQLEEAVSKLEAMAATDPLTRVGNRRSFNECLHRSMAESKRYGHDLACLMIDLDGFKQLNDTLGHQRGDELLAHAARVIEANSRASDVVARYGGDEFVLLLPKAGIAEAMEVATRIGNAFLVSARRMLLDTPAATSVTMSMGLSCLSITNPDDANQLIAQADHALYRAKQGGRARVMIYEAPSSAPGKRGRPPTTTGESGVPHVVLFNS